MNKRTTFSILVLLTKASLLTLWLANGVHWAEALYVSLMWTLEVTFLVACVLLHLFVALGATTWDRPKDDRPTWMRYLTRGFHLSEAGLLIFIAGHPVLGCLCVLTIAVSLYEPNKELA